MTADWPKLLKAGCLPSGTSARRPPNACFLKTGGAYTVFYSPSDFGHGNSHTILYIYIYIYTYTHIHMYLCMYIRSLVTSGNEVVFNRVAFSLADDDNFCKTCRFGGIHLLDCCRLCLAPKLLDDATRPGHLFDYILTASDVRSGK